jgi:hypothetical protein
MVWISNIEYAGPMGVQGINKERVGNSNLFGTQSIAEGKATLK